MNSPLPLLLIAVSVFAICGQTSAQEATAEADATPTVVEELVFKTEWKGERIELPPPFAPEMTLKGIEEIRFAPGMFDPKSDSFFTYVFVFSVPVDQALTKATIEKETLAYYRGLAQSVLASKGKQVDASKFTFALEKAPAATRQPATVKPSDVTQYSGKLDWVEPFATAEPQILHFEIHEWATPATKRNYLFVCTSPKATTEPIWEKLRQVRQEFTFRSAPKK